MRFMILVKATKDSEAGARPPEELFAAMADYHEQLVKAACCLMQAVCSQARRAGASNIPAASAP